MILEKTIKEEWTDKNYSNNNYSYIAPASLLYVPILILERARSKFVVNFLVTVVTPEVTVSVAERTRIWARFNMLPESVEGVVDLVEGAIDGLVLCINKKKKKRKKEKR